MLTSTFKLGDYQLVANGDSGYAIMLTSPPCKELTKKILSLRLQISKELADLVTELIPSYQSLTLLFNPAKVKRTAIKKKLEKILLSSINYAEFESNCIEIPVCYSPHYAPDIERVAAHCGLTTNEVIEKHSAATYWVAMLGFLPGFVYLSGLENSLRCPRKNTPALLVPAGSIAIGDKQTGIYSLDSPGGWNVIGKTPTKLLNLDAERPIVINPLDEIKFVPISEQTYLQLQNNSNGLIQ